MSKRNLALDGLRGYAAIAVVIYHSILYFDPTLISRMLYQPMYHFTSAYDLTTKLCLALFNGETAVIIFFILSGAVLFESLHVQRERGFFSTVIQFTIRRIIRIYPALIFCLILFFAVFKIAHYLYPNLYQTYSNTQLIENMLLYNTGMHGASWTLKIEILVIPFILIGFYAHRGLGIAGLGIFLFYSIFVVKHQAFIFHLFTLYANLFYFALGMLIPTDLARRLFCWLRRFDWIPILIILLLVRHVLPHKSALGFLLQGSFAFLVVGMVYYHRSVSLNRFLERPVSSYLGKISYSFYLMNVIFLELVCQLLRLYPLATTHYLEFGLLAGLFIVGVTIPFAHFSEKYVERPSVKLGHLLKHMPSLGLQAPTKQSL